MGCSTGHKGLLSYISSFCTIRRHDKHEPIEISACVDVFERHQEITGLFGKKKKKGEVVLADGGF